MDDIAEDEEILFAPGQNLEAEILPDSNGMPVNAAGVFVVQHNEDIQEEISEENGFEIPEVIEEEIARIEENHQQNVNYEEIPNDVGIQDHDENSEEISPPQQGYEVNQRNNICSWMTYTIEKDLRKYKGNLIRSNDNYLYHRHSKQRKSNICQVHKNVKQRSNIKVQW